MIAEKQTQKSSKLQKDSQVVSLRKGTNSVVNRNQSLPRISHFVLVVQRLVSGRVNQKWIPTGRYFSLEGSIVPAGQRLVSGRINQKWIPTGRYLSP